MNFSKECKCLQGRAKGMKYGDGSARFRDYTSTIAGIAGRLQSKILMDSK